MNSLTTSKAWNALQTHFEGLRGQTIAALFREDPMRFSRFSLRLQGMLFDYSKNLLTDDTLRFLTDLAREQKLEEKRAAMFAGEAVNKSENRPAWHVALRRQDMPAAAADTLRRMHELSEMVRADDSITDIVSIGIGGSQLGPELAAEALTAFHHPRLRLHFVSNVEASDLDSTLKKLSPKSTLFIVCSKTFSTTETLQNAQRAKEWFYAGAAASFSKRFIAVTNNVAAAEKFGVTKGNIFPMEEYVGGRYSVWSAVGLCVMMMVGTQHFRNFLLGASAMDEHFAQAPLQQNMPVMAGLLSIWHRNFFNCAASAVIPYHAQLRRLPAWLQQLNMESNGKSVDQAGNTITHATAPVIFGEPGTDAQHSFFQWLHQGTAPTPVDFIGVIKTPYGGEEQQEILLANMLAQSETLMMGKEDASPHKSLLGNRPSSTILLSDLIPYKLGMLLAFYEHKTFVEGAIWGINSFDQWGVEHGKVAAKQIQADIHEKTGGKHDSSTAGLIDYISKNL